MDGGRTLEGEATDRAVGVFSQILQMQGVVVIESRPQAEPAWVRKVCRSVRKLLFLLTGIVIVICIVVSLFRELCLVLPENIYNLINYFVTK